MTKNTQKIAKQLRQSFSVELAPGQQQTRNLSDWLTAATELSQTGQIRAAERLLAQLVQQEQGQHALKYLLQLYLGNSWFYDASLQLQSLDPTHNDAELISVRAVTALKLGQLDDALKLFQRAIKLLPSSAQLAHGLGQCYMALGDKARAEKWYQRAIKRDPIFYGAYLSTAAVVDESGLAELSDAIDALLNKRVLADYDRAVLHFAKAKMAERRGNFDVEAMQLDAANALIQAADTDTQRAEHRQQQEDIGRYIEKMQDLTRKQDYDVTTTPIFICSLPRSGSSLLEYLLSRFPGVTPTGESGSLFAALRQLSQVTAEPPGSLLQASAIEHYREQLLAAHRKVLEVYQVDTPFFTDKSMINFLHLGRLLQLYPKARVLWLQRDPRDTAISCYQHLFEGGAGNEYIYSLETIAAQIEHVEACMQLWLEAFPDAIEHVSYEALASDSEAVLAKLTGFIGIDPLQTDTGHGEQRAVLTSSALQVREGVNSKAIGKAQHYPELAARFQAAYQSAR